MKILITTGYLEASVKRKTPKGDIKGISKSILNIIEGFRDIKNIQTKVIAQEFKNKLLMSVTLDSYVLIPKIVKTISQFKPDLIITQDRIAFPTILIAKLKKIPVIQIVRATVDFCPKYNNITGYGKACSGINSRKQCFKCINKWRTLRILIGNRTKGTEFSIRTSLVDILYRMRYFVCSFNIYLMNKANITLVASELMVKSFSYKMNQNKLKIINITPIQKHTNDKISKKKQLMFIRSHYDASHKGLDFVLRLSKHIPEGYRILIVGGQKESWKGEELDNVTNVKYISSKKTLNKVFAESIITLVPTFCTDAFGRIIPESLTNKTLVISSPQCGANQFFEGKNFFKVVPLKLNLWIKAIENTIQKPYVITDDDISQIYEQFSLEKSKKDFMKVIKEVMLK